MLFNNILIFTNTLFSGGAEKQSLFLAKALKEKFNVIFLIYYGEHCEDKYLNFLKELLIKPIRLSGSHIKKVITFYNILKQNRVEIIFSFLATTNLLNGLIGKFTGVNFLIGGIRSSLIPKHKQVIQKLLHNYFFNYTIFNNYSGKENLIKAGFNERKSIVIPNSIEINKIPPQKGKKDIIRILSVGRFVKAKDYSRAINIIDHLIKVNNLKNIEYTIVGYGEEEKVIRNLIEKRELNNLIKIILNPNNIDEIYACSDIYLSTSIFEGLSNSIMEAMNHSLPIVATNVGDNVKLIYNNENGFLVNDDDDDNVAKKLKLLIDNYDLRMNYGKKSFEIIKENYSFEIFQQNYFKFIENLS